VLRTVFQIVSMPVSSRALQVITGGVQRGDEGCSRFKADSKTLAAFYARAQVVAVAL